MVSFTHSSKGLERFDRASKLAYNPKSENKIMNNKSIHITIYENTCYSRITN